MILLKERNPDLDAKDIIGPRHPTLATVSCVRATIRFEYCTPKSSSDVPQPR